MRFEMSHQQSLGEIIREGDIQFFPMAFHYRNQDIFGVEERYLSFAIGRFEEEDCGFFDFFGVSYDGGGESPRIFLAFFGRIFEVSF